MPSARYQEDWSGTIALRRMWIELSKDTLGNNDHAYDDDVEVDDDILSDAGEQRRRVMMTSAVPWREENPCAGREL